MVGKRAAAGAPSGGRADKRSRSNPSDENDAADDTATVRAIPAPPPSLASFLVGSSSAPRGARIRRAAPLSLSSLPPSRPRPRVSQVDDLAVVTELLDELQRRAVVLGHDQTAVSALVAPLGELTSVRDLELPANQGAIELLRTLATHSPSADGASLFTNSGSVRRGRPPKNPDRPAAPRASPKCSIEECSRFALVGGLCCAHGGGRRCTEPGCTVGARSGGKCISHGGGRRCQHEGCGKGASGATAFCISHGGGDKCTVADCGRSRKIRGLCGYHSGHNSKKELCLSPGCRFKAVGDGRCRVHGGVRLCKHDACRNRAKARGLCSKHDEQCKRCSAEGCQRPTTARGLCKAHGSVSLKKPCVEPGCSNNPATGSDRCRSHGGGKRCAVEGCPKADVGGGRCVAHGGGRRCSREGCTKGAQGPLFCVAHGGGKRCAVDGCGQPAHYNGACPKHGGGKFCSHEGCGKWDAGFGFCRAHGGGRRCLVEGCETAARNRGLCIRHGGGHTCTVEGCTRTAKTRNLCIDHGGAKTCRVANCGKVDRGRGFCSRHGNLLGVGALGCVHEGCDKRAVNRRLCAEHGNFKRCASKGCQKMARLLGFCKLHAPAEAGAATGESPASRVVAEAPPVVVVPFGRGAHVVGASAER